jgi:hypothetical protein
MMKMPIFVFMFFLLILPIFQAYSDVIPLVFDPASPTVTVYTNTSSYNFVFRVRTSVEVDANLSPSVNYMQLNTTTMHLISGEAASVSALFNVSDMVAKGIQEAYAIVWFNGTITANGTKFRQAYLIHIFVKEPTPAGNITFSPYPLSVTIPRGSDSDFQVMITNKHPVKITINGYSASSLVKAFSPVPTQIVAGGLWTFTVRLSAKGLTVGNYSDVLRVNYQAEGYKTPLYRDLPIIVAVVNPPTPPPGEPGLYRVQLTFLDKKTGAAISGVRVVLSEVTGKTEYTGTSGESGTITFQDVLQGTYNLQAIHQNYQMTSSLTVNGNISKVFLLESLSESQQTEQPQQNATSELGVVGLPYNSKTVEITAGDEQAFYILVSAEGGPIGPIQIIPGSSVPNWISLTANWTHLAAGKYAALTLRVAPPLDIQEGRYSRQFQILGGKSPASFTVTVVVKKPNLTASNPSQPSTNNVDRGSVIFGSIPRVIVKCENGTALSTQITAFVNKGSLIYAIFYGEYTKIAYNLTGGLAVFDDQAGGGKRVLTLQVNADGDFNVYLVSKDEYGNAIRTQPAEYGFGVYRFRIIKPSGPPQQVLLSVDKKIATVGKEVTLMAYTISQSPGGFPVTQPFQGVVTVTTPKGEAIPVPLGLEGRASFVPVSSGVYKLSVQGVPIAAESVTEFEARAPEIPYIESDQLYVDQAKVWRWPVPFAGTPKCWAVPDDAVRGLNCDANTVSFIPTKPDITFSVYGSGPLAQPYDVYPSGAEVVFVLRSSRPVSDTIQASFSRFTGYSINWMGQNWLWITLAGLIVFAIVYKRLSSPRRAFGGKTGLIGRFGR